MRIVLGCTDGNTYKSKNITRAELQAELDAADGYLGTGKYANRKFASVDEFLEFMLEFAKYDANMNSQTFTITDEEDMVRAFNCCHIVWYGIEEE
jgi:hypothetical protein